MPPTPSFSCEAVQSPDENMVQKTHPTERHTIRQAHSPQVMSFILRIWTFHKNDESRVDARTCMEKRREPAMDRHNSSKCRKLYHILFGLCDMRRFFQLETATQIYALFEIAWGKRLILKNRVIGCAAMARRFAAAWEG